MNRKLIPILGITGGVLSLLESMLFTVVFSFTAVQPSSMSVNCIVFPAHNFQTGIFLIFVSAAGLAGSFIVRESPVKAGAVMIISGALLFLSYMITFMSRDRLLGIPSLLLIAAGLLALLSASKIFERMLLKHIDQAAIEKRVSLCRVIGIICAALQMLLWMILTVGEIVIWLNAEPYLQKILSSRFVLYFIIPLLVSAVGLSGSLLLRKKSKAGAVLMLVSGGVVFFYTFIAWWLGIAPLLLTAAGVFALVSSKRALSVQSSAEKSQGTESG
jgi:hypothetical protein